MITVRLKGGMGNQMFQYAFGYRMAKFLDTDLKLDLSILLDRSKKDIVPRNYDLSIFKLEPQFNLSPKLLKVLYRPKSSKVAKFVKKLSQNGKTYFKEKHFHVHQELLNTPINDAVYDGWWQSEQYFHSESEAIRQLFSFKSEILEKAKPMAEQIQSTNAICLNVRRTDFVKNQTLNTTGLSYFKKAAHYLAERIEDPHFFVFSDDISWCQKNIVLPFPTTIVTHDLKGEKFSNYLQLMKSCKHYIIPNSSFAWWAVWLNGDANKIVVAPKNWFNNPDVDTSDLVPSSWIRL